MIYDDCKGECKSYDYNYYQDKLRNQHIVGLTFAENYISCNLREYRKGISIDDLGVFLFYSDEKIIISYGENSFMCKYADLYCTPYLDDNLNLIIEEVLVGNGKGIDGYEQCCTYSLTMNRDELWYEVLNDDDGDSMLIGKYFDSKNKRKYLLGG